MGLLERIELPDGAWIDHVDVCSSTMDLARDAARQGCPGFQTIWAEEQTQGRGRQGKVWHGGAGVGLYFTVVLRPKLELGQMALIPLLAGAVLCAVVRALGVAAWLKWPNDLMVGEPPEQRKLAGLLLEHDAVSKTLLLGVGLNVQAVESDQPTVALNDFLPEVKRLELLRDFLLRLKAALDQFERSPSRALSFWGQHQGTLGRQVQISSANETFVGLAETLEHDGALLVRTEMGLRSVRSGEVSLRF